jgi:hypothetical protein
MIHGTLVVGLLISLQAAPETLDVREFSYEQKRVGCERAKKCQPEMAKPICQNAEVWKTQWEKNKTSPKQPFPLERADWDGCAKAFADAACGKFKEVDEFAKSGGNKACDAYRDFVNKTGKYKK